MAGEIMKMRPELRHTHMFYVIDWALAVRISVTAPGS